MRRFGKGLVASSAIAEPYCARMIEIANLVLRENDWMKVLGEEEVTGNEARNSMLCRGGIHCVGLGAEMEFIGDGNRTWSRK